MSSSNVRHDDGRLPDGPSRDGSVSRVAGGSLRRTVVAALSTLSFWCAIALPVVYVPLLAAGIDSTGGLLTFLGLFGLHVLALLGGRAHSGESDQ